MGAKKAVEKKQLASSQQCEAARDFAIVACFSQGARVDDYCSADGKGKQIKSQGKAVEAT